MKTTYLYIAVIALAGLLGVAATGQQELQASGIYRQAAAGPAKPKVKPYPLSTCIVSDEKLGEMGKPVVFEYKGREIKLCCKSCRKKFDKEPEKYLKKLEPKK